MSQEKFEINMFAHNAVVNNLSSRVIMEKLKEQGVKLEQFFIPYTLFKTGKFTPENYAATVGGFKQQFHAELEERYGSGFWFSKKSVSPNTENNRESYIAAFNSFCRNN